MSAATRIVPAIGHALEAGDLTAVRILMALLARTDESTAERIREAFNDGMAPTLESDSGGIYAGKGKPA